jgi:hypothetical protein
VCTFLGSAHSIQAPLLPPPVATPEPGTIASCGRGCAVIALFSRPNPSKHGKQRTRAPVPPQESFVAEGYHRIHSRRAMRRHEASQQRNRAHHRGYPAECGQISGAYAKKQSGQNPGERP